MVHAENYDAIRFLTDRMEQLGNLAPKFHASSRPVAVEREATHRAISLAEQVRGVRSIDARALVTDNEVAAADDEYAGDDDYPR